MSDCGNECVNKVMLVGRLGKDPQVFRFGSGGQKVSFSLATSDTWKDKQSGEKHERTEWHNVAIFNESIGKIAEQYLHKGDMIYVEGQIQTRKWEDKSGNGHEMTEVVLQGFNGRLDMLVTKGSSSGGGRSEYTDTRGEGKRDQGGGRVGPQIDDDIPF